MKKVEKKRFRCIHAATATEFETEIRKIYDTEPGAEVLFREQPFLAYVTWKVHELVPETVHDELYLKGIDLRCDDCPYLGQRDDRRVRWHSCKYADKEVLRSDQACELFCKRFIRGEVEKV